MNIHSDCEGYYGGANAGGVARRDAAPAPAMLLLPEGKALQSNWMEVGRNRRCSRSDSETVLKKEGIARRRERRQLLRASSFSSVVMLVIGSDRFVRATPLKQS